MFEILKSQGHFYIGDYKGNKKSGNGTLRYEDGATYCGQFVNDKKHGRF